MPRKPRLHYPGALYHVISRGNNRQNIYSSEQDYQKFLEYVRGAKEKAHFFVYAFCLMPNHFHLLIEVRSKPLSVIMQRILTGYTRYYNRTYKKRGHLFQGRYKAVLCEKDSYLLELVRYIHLNPVRAKLAKEPGAWQWCGHSGLSGITNNRLIDEGFVLKYFNSDKAKARDGYRTFVRDGLRMGHQCDLYPEEKVPYIGSEEFITDHVCLHEALFDSLTSGAKQSISTLAAVMSEVSAKLGVGQEVIGGNSRKKKPAKARREFIIAGYKAGHKAADIARFIKRSHAFVTREIDRNAI